MFKQRAWLLCCVAMGFIGLAIRANIKAVCDTAAAKVEDKSVAQAKSEDSRSKMMSNFRASAVRYQVKDVDRAVAFYTQHLGFKVEQPVAPAFAKISNGNLTLWLSGPQSSGSRPMPDGRRQEPGGWNRIVLTVDDLPSIVETMKKAGFRFRNQIETGPGGKQIQLEDPDGNPIELFEPAS
jgi:glyoxylase I family protein